MHCFLEKTLEVINDDTKFQDVIVDRMQWLCFVIVQHSAAQVPVHFQKM